jgi:GNAT superfamily N-acetyltransferase
MIKLKELLMREDIPKMDVKVNRFERQLKRKFPQLEDLHFYIKSNGSLFIGSIIVYKNMRGQGIGSKVLNLIKDFADKNNLIISLSPEADSGKKSKLDRFYKNAGFIDNKGRNKDYQLSEPFGRTMYRRPNG